jgi:hypothetical protein
MTTKVALKNDRNCMTVYDLRRVLEQFDDNDFVYLAAPSHDHWGRVLALPVEEVEEVPIRWSDYHDQYQIVGVDEDWDGGDLQITVVGLGRIRDIYPE